MKTDIKPFKLYIDYGLNGEFTGGQILYQIVDDSGEVSKQYYSASIKSIISVAQINIIMEQAIKLAKKQEGING